MHRSCVLLLLLFVLRASPAEMCGPSNQFVATSTSLDAIFEEIHWFRDEKHAMYAFLSTHEDGLYRTKDGGLTWEDAFARMVDAKEPQPPYDRFGVARVHRSADPLTWYLNGYGVALWRTVDGGDSYQYLPTEEHQLHTIKPHPTHARVLLGQASSARCFDDTVEGVCVEQLLISDDGGDSWRFVLDYVFPGKLAWGHSFDTAQDAAIWAIDWADKNGAALDKDEFDLRLVSSNDEFSTPARVQLEHAVDFLIDWEDQFMLAAVIRSDGSDSLTLYASPNRGMTFARANFPADLSEQFYTFMDHSDGVVFVHVRESFSGDSGVLFASDGVGLDFALSLPYVSVRNRQVEFRRMYGIDGVYVANQKRVPEDALDARVLTMLSRDKGATWAPIDATSVRDMDGAPLGCPHTASPDGLKGCYLNFGVTGKSAARTQHSRGAFHSSRHAPGTALVVGNVGAWYDPPLARDELLHATFLTRDAGVSWVKVRNGSHVAAIGDQGNLLVLAPDEEHTDTIYFSTDAGHTWSSCQFTKDDKLLVNNIVTKSEISGTEVLLMGSQFASGDHSGVVVHLSFQQFDRECADADYEQWQVPGAGNTCFLGATTTYKRRRPSATCHSAEFNEPTKQPCECAPVDYECDFCYEAAEGGLCSRVRSAECPDVLPEPSDCVDSYKQSRGYRRIPGDVCSPPVASFEPIVRQCSTDGQLPSSSSAWTAVIVIVLLVALAVLACVVAFKKNTRFERFVRQLRIPGVAPNVAYVGSSAFDDGQLEDDDLLGDTGGYEST